MKLKIETWLEQNNFSDNVNLLFNDSIICYKAGANRASLLFSYLGFLTILKERIISSKKPTNYIQINWDNLITKLNDEDNWEQETFDATQKKQKLNSAKVVIEDAIFSINENLREQIKYWKNRRNDCAHFKNNIIDSFHIDSFWAFIESNLPKITVEGGIETLINKIRIHFDPTLTPPDKDLTYLVLDIENSVENVRYQEFWKLFINQNEYEIGHKRLNFISKSLETNNKSINQELIKVIKREKYYIVEFLEFNPTYITYLNLSKEEVREFWNKKLIGFRNPLKIYANLLNNNLIPKNQIEEANNHLASFIKRYELELNEHFVLQANGFYDSLKRKIFNDSRFMEYLWVNDKSDLISDIILKYDADLEVINRIFESYSKSTNSNWLLERFDKIFTKENQITSHYKKIISDNNLEVPTKLTKYFA